MSDSGSVEIPEAEAEANERNDARQAKMKEYFARTEKKLFALFGKGPRETRNCLWTAGNREW